MCCVYLINNMFYYYYYCEEVFFVSSAISGCDFKSRKREKWLTNGFVISFSNVTFTSWVMLLFMFRALIKAFKNSIQLVCCLALMAFDDIAYTDSIFISSTMTHDMENWNKIRILNKCARCE